MVGGSVSSEWQLGYCGNCFFWNWGLAQWSALPSVLGCHSCQWTGQTCQRSGLEFSKWFWAHEQYDNMINSGFGPMNSTQACMERPKSFKTAANWRSSAILPHQLFSICKVLLPNITQWWIWIPYGNLFTLIHTLHIMFCYLYNWLFVNFDCHKDAVVGKLILFHFYNSTAWGGSGSGLEWLDVNRKVASSNLGSARVSVLEQDTEPLITPDVLAGALHGFRHHWCVNVVHIIYIVKRLG